MKDNKFNFQKLTPTKDVDLTLYEDALGFVFDNKDIHNVAISGAYGAGKSSIIESYKNKNNNTKFLHISLAHFEQPDKMGNVNVKEITLEGKILNQLIHQIPAEKIPQSNFRVKKKVKGITRSVVLTLLFILSLFHIIFFNAWSAYVSSLSDSILKFFLRISSNQYSLLASGIICFSIAGIFIKTLISIQKNKNVFRKISLQGNEIEIFEDNEDSYFDKYLNEVLYLFENTEADVIVFEDMDRFNSNRIFERLREINTLVNIQLTKDDKPPLRFFYLLRDDIFISKDRTKFFDYIIPIVPVVDSSNSYNQFIAHFKNGGIFDLFDESFLQGLSLYVDDMRILKNIYNEFVIYYNRLNITELDCNKMLALITYKNIFPRDFSELQLNRGFVFTLFSNKDSIIQESVSQIEEQIELLNKKIEDAKNEHLQSDNEVDEVYKNQLENLRYQARYNAQPKAQLDALIVDISKRKEDIANKEVENKEKLIFQISEHRQSILALQDRKMAELITRKNIDIIFSVNYRNEIGKEFDFHDIKGSEYFQLLKYLIRNGYIDETYADYMTYFYENSLSRIDKVFLRSVSDKNAKDFTYTLKTPSMVVSRLRAADFDQEEVLNFDLLEFLLKNPIHSDFTNRFMRQLRETTNFQFIGAFFDTARELSNFIRTLNSSWNGLFYYTLNKNSLTDKQLRLYSIYSLYYSDTEDIQKINQDGCLTQYISNSSDYLNISEPKIEKLINGFKVLEVCFVHIDSNKANSELLEAVYKNSLYEINFANISLMLNTFYSTTDKESLQHKNYTLVSDQPTTPLFQYVNLNISEYIEIVLAHSDEKIIDSEDAVVSILNNDQVKDEQKNKYIAQLTTIITSIDKVNNNVLWKALLSNAVAEYSEENIFDYYCIENTLDETLVNFINSSEKKLDFSIVKNHYGDEKSKNLFRTILKCNDLSDKKYREILLTLSYYYESFSIDGVSDPKFRIIVDLNIPRMTSESLVFIREHYPSQCLYFIELKMSISVDTKDSRRAEMHCEVVKRPRGEYHKSVGA